MKLKYKLILLALVPMTVATVLSTVIGSAVNQRALREQLNYQAGRRLDLQAEQIRSFLEQHVRALRILSASSVLQEGAMESIARQLTSWKSRSPEIEGLYYNDAEGNVHDGSGAFFNVRDRPYHPLVQRGEEVITGALVSRATGRPIVLILVPILAKDGTVAGALGASVLIEDLIEKVRQGTVGYSGFSFLVDDEGRVLSGDPADAVTFPRRAFDAPAAPSMAGIVERLRRDEPSPLFVGLDGEACRVYYRSIPKTPWILGLVFKEAELLRYLHDSRMIAMATLGVTSLLALGIAAALYRVLINPIHRLMEAQKRVADGELDALAAEGANDEFGELARSFNRMASSLSQAHAQVLKELENQERAETSLRASEERYRLLVENSHDMIAELNESAELIYVNGNVEQLLGYTPEEMRTGVSLGWVHPDDARAVNEAYRDAKGHVEHRFLHKEGTWRWVESSFRRFPSSGGGEHFVVLSRDITERKRAEETRERLESELRQSQKMEAIGTLAGGIAHDFNNILTVILGNTEMAKMDLPEDHSAVDFLVEATKAAQVAKELVEQILTFSRKGEVRRTLIPLQPVVRESLRLVRSTLPSSIEVYTDIAPDIPAVLADPTQIQQVMINLCANGAHAMRETGGRLEVTLSTLRVEDEASGRQLGGISPGDYVRLSVCDTGCGMDPATKERIFDPFFTTKGPGEGTGLGLAVVHGIVESHEGSIVVESELGKGSRFHLHFPAILQGAVENEDEIRDVPKGNGEGILLVDDEPTVLFLVSQMLRRMGYRVTEASSAALAWEAFQLNPDAFDLIVSDLKMPRMTGVELASRVRAIDARIPILLISGNLTEVDEEKRDHLDLFAVLHKPFRMEQLLEAIAKALSRP